MIVYMEGIISLIMAALMLIPLSVSLIYRDGNAMSFAISAGISALIGLILKSIGTKRDGRLYAKEGFIIVALAWIIMSLLGALPFYLSGEISSFADSVFEIVSGFTTTGASIVLNVEELSRSILFWRSFSHWIGGMGVLVFIMAILPSDSGRTMHIMRAEMPGPIVGKLVPKVRETAKILYLIYIGLTAMQVIMLLLGGMPLFDSLIHSFGTAGTGGFGIKANSVGGYSPYIQWVITVFMLIFGVNFNLFYLILIRRFKSVLKSTELWCYVFIVLLSTGIITAQILPSVGGFSEAVRASAFQVSSIITTTGYSTVDFNLWPTLSKGILIALMFIGGCAGSTAGGLKVSRVILLFKMIRRDIRRLLHPRSVGVIKLEGRSVDETTLGGVSSYFALYIISFVAIFLLLCIEAFDFETTFTAVSACFNNVGPGFGAVGPMSSFAIFSSGAKYLLSIAMLLGRLEIFPLLIALSPSTWTKK